MTAPTDKHVIKTLGDYWDAIARHTEAREAHRRAVEMGDYYAAAVAFTDACEAFDGSTAIWMELMRDPHRPHKAHKKPLQR